MFQVVSMEGCNMPGISRAHDLKERSDAQIIEHRLVRPVRFSTTEGSEENPQGRTGSCR